MFLGNFKGKSQNIENKNLPPGPLLPFGPEVGPPEVAPPSGSGENIKCGEMP